MGLTSVICRCEDFSFPFLSIQGSAIDRLFGLAARLGKCFWILCPLPGRLEWEKNGRPFWPRLTKGSIRMLAKIFLFYDLNSKGCIAPLLFIIAQPLLNRVLNSTTMGVVNNKW